MKKAALRIPEFEVDKYLEENMTFRRESLDNLADKMKAGGLEVETSLRVGVPYEALLQEIGEKKPDLLVMGTKGRSNLVDMILGSCAQKMFRRSPIPLLSVRGK
jgi:nucleotide-binding universal stress UspA family protein